MQIHSIQRVILRVFTIILLGCQLPLIEMARAKEDSKDVLQLETETVTAKKQRWDPKKTHPEVFDPVDSVEKSAN